ncbi:hypothetical protein SLS56_001783 [Neofusicoccum ribis]|uniref:Nephrocystin 3-like N-terminal domain-containing protein n=1 Tax=Neofusicoccum ribis TaxID=45134 RepID=A0ABR3T732_9PEZI
MKYIFTHPKFSENLEHWAGDDLLVTAKFFIINRAPSPLQKSGVELLRSLLVQLLEASPEFVSIITRSRGQGRREERPTENMKWTWPQLQRAFEACLAQKPRDVKICFVVDGLDEYNIPSKSSDPGEPETTTFSKQQRGFEEIFRFFLEAWNYPGIKFCLASRPLITFDDQLRDFPNINLHDLTKRDMRNYIEDQLSKRTSQLKLLGEPHAKERITNTVQEKANGVFLWVRLVVDKVLLKLRNRDDFASIELELRALPDELGGPDGLYALMLLDDVVPENRAEGIRILYHILVLSAKTFTTLGLEVAEHLSGNPDTLLASIRHLYPLLLSEDDIDRRIKRFEGRVKSCCAGLAEVYLAGKFTPEMPGYDSWRFIHETVQEFLIEGLVSNKKLVELKADKNESSVRAVGALVAQLFLIKTARDPWHGFIGSPFEIASSALELLDRQGVRYRTSLYFEFLDEVRFIGKLLASRYGEFESMFRGKDVIFEEVVLGVVLCRRNFLNYLRAKEADFGASMQRGLGLRSRPLLDLALTISQLYLWNGEPILGRSETGEIKLHQHLKQYLLEGEEQQYMEIDSDKFVEDPDSPYSVENLKALLEIEPEPVADLSSDQLTDSGFTSE